MSGSSTRSRWSSAWEDILSGGNPRWRITSEESHEKAYANFYRFLPEGTPSDDKIKNISVLCPLAGDDPFVHLLYRKGYSVTAIDLVSEAVEAMKAQFDGGDDSSWAKEEDENNDGSVTNIVWKHSSGRATLIVGDAMKKRTNLNQSFDAVYDKDSFGALPKELRKPFCQRISEYTKENGILYLECKLKKGGDDSGPPFSLQRGDLMEDDNFGGGKFEYIKGLGRVYDLPGNMNAVMQQTGHVLRRCSRAAAP
ncbi:unnamed protein product [Pseudo-nitzschia multistriata]|uniref:Methyltransferase type 11 domain-containing protein n=1 Tax=Pseudo-nitzschia multistriata TaxID=183589 RepID=A0A448Z4S5_9STRA|nr:unnamed protein product [Pseudo-nitzschia multistriata]